MAEKDRRYKTVKIMIEAGHIAEFKQIFDHIPKTVVATHLGTNYNRLRRLIEAVDQFTLQELFTLAKYFDIDEKRIVDLAYAQYQARKKPKKKG